jgi:hypothetical protein
MKRSLFVFAAVLSVSALESAVVARSQAGHLLSPNGTKVAFLWFDPPSGPSSRHPEPIGQPEVRDTLSVADVEGTKTLDFPPVKFREGEVPVESFDYLWSPDSRLLAVRAGRDLWLMDAVDGMTTRVTTLGRESIVTSFAWTDPGQVIYVTRRGSSELGGYIPIYARDSGSGSAIEVYRIAAAASGAKVPVFAERLPQPQYYMSRRAGSGSNDELSPHGNWLLFGTGAAARCVDLKSGKVTHELVINRTVSAAWWAPTETYCLLRMQKDTGPPAVGATADGYRYFLLDTRTGGFEDVNSKLRQLNGDYKDTPDPDIMWPVWNHDGKWFSVFGCKDGKKTGAGQSVDFYTNWICRVEPWDSVCVSDVIGTEAHGVLPAPVGNRLVILGGRCKLEGLFEGQVNQEPGGRLVIEKVVSIQPKEVRELYLWKESFLWSSDGRTMLHGNWPAFARLTSGE